MFAITGQFTQNINWLKDNSVMKADFVPLQAEADATRDGLAALKETAYATAADMADLKIQFSNITQEMQKQSVLFQLFNFDQESKTLHVGGPGLETVMVQGANLQVVNGTGANDQSNGLGNVIVGYNLDGPNPLARTGSHNLVLGDFNGYSSFGGIVAGTHNTISAPFASITGGQSNIVSAMYGTIHGGTQNQVNALFSTISGGSGNMVNKENAVIGGGENNTLDFADPATWMAGPNTHN